MHWFFFALIGPVLYACTNHIDKYLIAKYVKNQEVGALIIFSSIFSIAALPFVLSIHPSIFDVSFFHGLILVFNSMLLVVAVLFYFYALQKDEASYVVPFYQTIPIFAFALGYFILGERVYLSQILASLLIIFGALVLSVEFTRGNVSFKRNVICLMLAASLLYAVNGVIFKLVALDEGFWPSIFWGLAGKTLLGFIFLIFIPSYRSQFLRMMHKGGTVVLLFNSLSELLFIVAEAVTQYATLLAPVALVLLVNSFQPLFVFILGILLSFFFTSISRESLDFSSLMQKLIGISLIILGTFFLSRYLLV